MEQYIPYSLICDFFSRNLESFTISYWQAMLANLSFFILFFLSFLPSIGMILKTWNEIKRFSLEFEGLFIKFWGDFLSAFYWILWGIFKHFLWDFEWLFYGFFIGFWGSFLSASYGILRGFLSVFYWILRGFFKRPSIGFWGAL